MKPDESTKPQLPSLATVETKPTDVKPADVKPTEVKPTDVKPADVKPTDVKVAKPETKPVAKVRKAPTAAELMGRLDRLAPKLAAAGPTERMFVKKYRDELSAKPTEERRLELAGSIDELSKRLNGL